MSQLNLNIFIVTNQSGIAKNLLTLDEFKLVNDKIIEILRDAGRRIDKTFFDTSDSSNPSSRRKPNLGMIYEALVEFDIALVKSWVIGDKDSDMLLGKFCNMKTIYIKNDLYKYNSELKPDFEVNNLFEAYKIIEKFV
jgi:histidinol-phosphate phosphatase family protein